VGVVVLAIFTLNPSYQFRGSVIDPPVPAPEIELMDSSRQPFSLNAYRGKIVFLFFGYASCPDVCPTTLADLKQTRAYLEEQADSTQVVFITLDPDRDTPDKIQAYTSLFDPNFIGLTGSMEELDPIWEAYGVFREIDKETITAAGYLVSHSARIYLIDQDGNLHITYTFGTPPEDIAMDTEHLLN
jgi:protein SCO1/2